LFEGMLNFGSMFICSFSEEAFADENECQV